MPSSSALYTSALPSQPSSFPPPYHWGLPSCTGELTVNFAELTSSYERACCEAQKLQLINHNLSQVSDDLLLVNPQPLTGE